MTVYVVGFHPDPESRPDQWGVRGIFTDRQRAEAECKDWKHWIGPIELDESTGDELLSWPNWEQAKPAELKS